MTVYGFDEKLNNLFDSEMIDTRAAAGSMLPKIRWYTLCMPNDNYQPTFPGCAATRCAVPTPFA